MNNYEPIKDIGYEFPPHLNDWSIRYVDGREIITGDISELEMGKLELSLWEHLGELNQMVDQENE